MSKPIVWAIFLSICVLIPVSLFPTFVQGETFLDTDSLISVTIHNDLEYEEYGISIFYLYLTPTDSEYYSGDLMDSTGTLYMDYGDYMTLYLTPGDYDLLVVDEDFDIWYQTYTISGSGGGTRSTMDIYLDEADMYFEVDGSDVESTYLDINVDTESPVEYLFFSPADSDYWGADYLGGNILEKGDMTTISFGPGSLTTFDMLVIFSDGDQIVMEVDGTFDDSITLVDIPADDDDDTPVDDDDDTPVDDDDDTPVDDDDDTPVDDDDDLPPGEQPGGVPGTGGGVEGENKKDSNALGFAFIIAAVCLVGVLFRFKRIQ